MPSLPRLFRPPQLGSRRTAEASRQRFLAERRGSRLESKAWWQRQRRLFRNDPKNAVCCCCKANGVVRATDLVDHIVPHDDVDGPLFRDAANWQPLCNPCHEHIKKPIELRFARGEASVEDLRLDRLFPEHFG